MWPNQGYWPQQWPPTALAAAGAAPPPQEGADAGEWALKAAQWAQQRQLQEQYFQSVAQWQQQSHQEQAQLQAAQQQLATQLAQQELLSQQQQQQQPHQSQPQPHQPPLPTSEPLPLFPPVHSEPSPVPVKREQAPSLPQDQFLESHAGHPPHPHPSHPHQHPGQRPPPPEQFHGDSFRGERPPFPPVDKEFAGRQPQHEFPPQHNIGRSPPFGGHGIQEEGGASRRFPQPPSHDRGPSPRGMEPSSSFSQPPHPGLRHEPDQHFPRHPHDHAPDQRPRPPRDHTPEQRPRPPTEEMFERMAEEEVAAITSRGAGEAQGNFFPPSSEQESRAPDGGRGLGTKGFMAIGSREEQMRERNFGEHTRDFDEDKRDFDEEEMDFDERERQEAVREGLEGAEQLLQFFRGGKGNEAKAEQPRPSNRATMPSLHREARTAIPGLGGIDSQTAAEPPSVPTSLAGETGRTDQPAPAQTNQKKVIKSLGRIVSQLQTLQGLTSSLQLLKKLPKAHAEQLAAVTAAAAKSKAERETAARSRESAEEDRHLTEELKQKVAAMLANESDSDGEQSDKAPEPVPSQYAARPLGTPSASRPSPPAREFDGTFDVKPQVYSTYSNQEGQYGRERERGGEYDRKEPPPPSRSREGYGRAEESERGASLHGEDREMGASLSGEDRNWSQSGTDYRREARAAYQREDRYEEYGYPPRSAPPPPSSRGFPERESEWEQERERPPPHSAGYRYPPAGSIPRERELDYPKHERKGDLRAEQPVRRRDYDAMDYPPRVERYPSETEEVGREYAHRAPPPPSREAPSDRDYPPPAAELRKDPPPMSHPSYPPPLAEREERAGRYPPPASNAREGDRYYTGAAEPPRGEGDRTHSDILGQIESIDYSHGTKAALPNVQSVDYHHGKGGGAGVGATDYPERARPAPVPEFPTGPTPRYPPPGYPMALPGFGAGPVGFGGFPGAEGFGTMPYPYPGGGGMGYFPAGFDPASLFAAYAGAAGDTKRKTLPLWLREALEKMERDKQKKQEKEVKLSAKEGGSATGEEEGGKLSWKAELEMDEEREEEREEAGGRAWRSYRYELAKAKKESDSDEGDSFSPPPRHRRKLKPLEPESEEDKQVNKVVRIRKMLTEVLLEVTSAEIKSVAEETYEEIKHPKLAFQVKGPHKVKRRDNVLGLNMYVSESESDVSEEEGSRGKKKQAKSAKMDPTVVADTLKGKERDKDRERERGREERRDKSSRWGQKERRESEEHAREKLERKKKASVTKSSTVTKSSGATVTRVVTTIERGKEKPSKSSSHGHKRSHSPSSSPHPSSGGSKHKSKSHHHPPSPTLQAPPQKAPPPSSSSSSSSSRGAGKGFTASVAKETGNPKGQVNTSGLMIPRKILAKTEAGKLRNPTLASRLSPTGPPVPTKPRPHKSASPSPPPPLRKRSRLSSPSSPPPSRGRGRGSMERIVRQRSRSRSHSPSSPSRPGYSKWSARKPPQQRYHGGSGGNFKKIF